MLFSIDYRYVCARDNYTCRGCEKELTDPQFKKIDEMGEDIASNTATYCGICDYDPRPVVEPGYGGKLIVVTGPMFAAKSTATRALYNKHKVFTSKCVWVKPHIDDRSNGFTETHDKSQFEALTIRADRPDKHLIDLLLHKVIAIDEIQFFSDRILYVVHRLLLEGKVVIVNGLKLTAKRDLFGMTHYLMAEADEIISLKAVCSHCKQVDSATRTKSNNQLHSVQTGGAETYYVVCPDCDGECHEFLSLKTNI